MMKADTVKLCVHSIEEESLMCDIIDGPYTEGGNVGVLQLSLLIIYASFCLVEVGRFG